MRKSIIGGLLWLVFAILFTGEANSQILYGASSSQDSLWGVDTTTWSIALRIRPTLAGNTITGIHGIAYDPIEHQAYCILKTSALPNSTLLARISLSSGVCTQIGDLGAVFSSITFRADGQLMGVVADGGAMADQVFLINKANATKTLATTLGNGDSGEVLSSNFDDGMLYHWSGASSMVFEKFPANSPYSPLTNITTTGSAGGEITGAIYLGNNQFIVSNAASQLRHLGITGQYGNALTTAPDDLRGLVLPPQFTLSDDIVCINEVVTWDFKGLASDTAVYDWGDGTVTKVFPAGPSTHIYTVAGNLVSSAGLKNSVSGLDTLVSLPVRVNPLPFVTLIPGNDTILCLEDTLVITATFGGTSRWFRNGVLIPGATTNVYAATLNGWYNMAKTNTNGCIDSAFVGISVIFVHGAPSSTITADTTGCPTVAFQSNTVNGTSWNWAFGDGATSTAQNPSHTYNAVGTYNVFVVAENECFSMTDSASVVVDCFIGLGDEMVNSIHISPNPSHGRFSLNIDLPEATTLEYQISDLNGRILFSKNTQEIKLQWDETIEFQGPAGLYFLTVKVGTQSAAYRLLISEK